MDTRAVSYPIGLKHLLGIGSLAGAIELLQLL